MRGASPISRLALTCALGAAVLAVAAPAALADWTRPFNVSGALTQDALPSVGISDAGVSLYAWRRTVSGIERIQIRTRSAAGALGSVTNVSSSLSATQPEVEMNGGGTAAVLYVQFDGTDDRLAVNVRTSGGSISARQLVSGSGSTISDFAGGIDDTNRALLVWRSGAGVRARFRAADGTLSPIKALSNSFGASHPRVAVNGAGNCVIVWTQDTVVHIRSCSTVSQTFGADKIASAGVADDPEVGISDAGRAVAVWSRFDNGANENSIEARVLTTSGSLATTKTIDSDAAGAVLFQPHVAVDGAGLAAIAYRAEDVAEGGGIINTVKAATLPTTNNPTPAVP